MGTRYTRLTWSVLKEKRTLAMQIKLPTSRTLQQDNRFPKILSTIGEIGLQSEKSNVYTKTDINQTESKWVLQELLARVWKSTSEVSKTGSLNQQFFLRSNPELAQQKVIVEFGSPNIAKPLHMGHLRSTVTGHYVSRVCKAAGHDVTNICFLGDWGTQFGILQVGRFKFRRMLHLPMKSNYN